MKDLWHQVQWEVQAEVQCFVQIQILIFISGLSLWSLCPFRGVPLSAGMLAVKDGWEHILLGQVGKVQPKQIRSD